MNDVLATIRSFVGGELSPAEFRDQLYSDSRFEDFLAVDPQLRPGNYVRHSVYYFLLELDYDDPGDILNAQGALTDFMDRNGIEYHRTAKYQDLFDLILKSQPGWLCVDSKYVQTYILPAAENRSGDSLRQWLEEEFLRRFRFVSEPPNWIQSPAWPINENGPLVFLGQLDVNAYFHDEATVYVFHDPVSGCCQTVVQVF